MIGKQGKSSKSKFEIKSKSYSPLRSESQACADRVREKESGEKAKFNCHIMAAFITCMAA